jgi:hypothetical protein
MIEFVLCFVYLLSGVENLLSEGVKAPSVLNGGLDNAYVLLGTDYLSPNIICYISCNPPSEKNFLLFKTKQERLQLS